MNFKKQIESYAPFNEQEEKDKEYFLKWANAFEDILTRDNEFAHISSSAFVVNKARTKMLVVRHNLFGNWIYPGGHADGEVDLLSVAIREVEEETGLVARPISREIFAIQATPIAGHIKRGKYVSAHTHLDVVYLLEADDKIPLEIKEDENSGVKWIPLDREAYGKNIVDFMRPTNKKLIEKLQP